MSNYTPFSLHGGRMTKWMLLVAVVAVAGCGKEVLAPDSGYSNPPPVDPAAQFDVSGDCRSGYNVVTGRACGDSASDLGYIIAFGKRKHGK